MSAELREVYNAVSPDGIDHWEAMVAKIWRLWRTEPNMSLGQLLNVSAPTVVIFAAADVATVEHAEVMRRALPDGRLEVVPDANHGLPMEKPDVVARLVLDFLGAKGQSGAMQ